MSRNDANENIFLHEFNVEYEERAGKGFLGYGAIQHTMRDHVTYRGL